MRKSYRIKLKVQRIQEARRNKEAVRQKEFTYENVFTYHNFIAVLPKCFKNVGWKSSVQNYEINAIRKTYHDYIEMMNHNLPVPLSDKLIKIFERGKARIITPIHIKDRVIQKVLCDYALTPIISSKLIYDNGASLKDKGVEFTRKRVLSHLHSATRKYKNNFYILSFDFKNFFDSIPHSTCRMLLDRYILDKSIVNITMDVIKSTHKNSIRKIEDKSESANFLRRLDNDELSGICLGSQVSQVIALLVANDIDHYIKDVKKIKLYCRYMDDGIVISESKEELKELLAELKLIAFRLGLHFNEHKTYIVKASRGFTFLKVKYNVTDTGKIIRRLTHKGVVRMRRKLHKLKPKADDGVLTIDNVYDSMQSWLSHSRIANSYTTVKNMLRIYDNLYGGYKLTKKWNKTKGGKLDGIFQADKWAKYRWGYHSV